MLIPLVFASLVSSAQNPEEIIRKMESLVRGDKSYSEVTMRIVRPRYSREIGNKNWSLGDDDSMLLITSPARDKGIGYLKRDREIWNWMPSIDRLIKLPPSMMSQSWMGSDFTNDDLVRETSAVNDYTHRHLGMEDLDGFRCHKIEMIPKPDKPIVWSKVITWISEKEYYQLRTEQYDERGVLVNVISFREIRQMADRSLPSVMELIPQDKKGHSTVLITHSLDFNPSLDKDFFSIQNLKRIQ